MQREYESTIVSIIVANCLHEARILDPTDPAQQVGPLVLDTLLDGDIPARISVQKESSGPALIEWHLWAGEAGRRTWGTMSVGRLSVTRSILEAGSYGRSRKRSLRLAKIPLPDAKWGLISSEFEKLGITTTY